MTSPLELLAKLLFPPRGKHRARPARSTLPSRPVPAPVRRVVVRARRPVVQVFDGDATATVRPYVLAVEGAGW